MEFGDTWGRGHTGNQKRHSDSGLPQLRIDIRPMCARHAGCDVAATEFDTRTRNAGMQRPADRMTGASACFHDSADEACGAALAPRFRAADLQPELFVIVFGHDNIPSQSGALWRVKHSAS